jgi:hypothetical protein
MQFAVNEVNKMNERIDELMIQADAYACTISEKYVPECGEVNYLWEGAFRKKFAELIIQECLTICEELGDKGMDGHYCADEISKTFRR